MPEHHNSSGDEGPIMRPTKGATRLIQLLMRIANDEKTLVHIDVNTSIALSPHANVSRRYLGVLA